MSRIAYCNGRWLPITAPALPVEDRGAQFADAVYEVIKAVDRRPRDLERHLDRLGQSLAAIGLTWPMSRAALTAVIQEAVRRSALRDATIYLQVGRGAAPRYHPFPRRTKPSLVVTIRRAAFPGKRELEQGVRVISLPDERWAHCDIKSVGLLPNVLARQRATEIGCREAWLVDPAGHVTEGSGSNAYIVDRDGRVVTRPLGSDILPGVARSNLLDLARAHGVEVQERPFTIAEAVEAREAFLTSTTSLVLPVVEIDGRPIGNGRPGEIARTLLGLYAAHCGLGARHGLEASADPA